MATSARVQDFLVASRVPFEVVAHSRAYTAQGVAHASHVSGWQVAKVVLVRPSSGPPLMAVLPAACRLDFEHLGQVAGSKGLRLVPETEMSRVFPDCETGAMPPFGNLYGLPVYVDEHLAREPEFVFQAGSHQEAFRVRWADFDRVVHPTVADFCSH
jgi:Ala-tRNA(Pro) deacylase